MTGVSHRHISNIRCPECGRTTLEVSEINGKEVECVVCRTCFTSILNEDDSCSLIRKYE